MNARWLVLLALIGTTGVVALVLNLQSVVSPEEDGMVWIPAGSFDMGDSHGNGYPADGETPVHRVSLRGFWIDRYEVTNARFQQFVDETGYQTEADRLGWSGVPASMLTPPQQKQYPSNAEPGLDADWRLVTGANWHNPEGPGSTIAERMDHPAVHISWNDAVAFCRWRSEKTGHKWRLPTEAEWEYAARGGQEHAPLPWGAGLQKDGRWYANLWQGPFPDKNTADDGYVGTAPVGRFTPNGYGLYDVSGNVWEWCSDWFDPQYYQHSPGSNPQGPKTGRQKIQRGGSFLCCDECCRRYRVAARFHNDADSGMANSGFRCVREE